MDGPGASLFQGAGSIQINRSAEKQQEEEELHERKIREEKLQNELYNAFDDLEIEDDTIATENDSNDDRSNVMINMFNDDHHQQTNGIFKNGSKNPGQMNLIVEINHLKNALDSKTREVMHVHNLHQETKKQLEAQINDVKKRFALSEAEKERAHMSRQQTHELLVESKTKISDQEDTILKLKSKIKNLESSQAELTTELEHTRTLLSDCQHKFHMVERDAGFSATKHADTLLKQSEERHCAKIDLMQQQIDSLRGKLEEKESELNLIDRRYKELQRSREALLVEKSETINQLSKTIEDSQKQCQMLMAKGDSTQENIRLRNMVTDLQKQTEHMQKTINNLTQRLESTNNESYLDTIPSPGQFNRLQKNVGCSTPLSSYEPPERVFQLKNELNRCMASQKEKRDVIKRLEEQVASKNEEIKRLKDDENSVLVQMMAYKDESSRLSIKLKHFQNEMENITKNGLTESVTNQTSIELRRLESENRRLQSTIDGLTQDLNNLQSDYRCIEEKYEEIKTERDRLTRNGDECQVNIAGRRLSLNSENELLKNQLEKQQSLLDDTIKECDRLKNYTIDLSLARDHLTRELNELKKLNVHSEKVSTLEQELQISKQETKQLREVQSKEKTEYENSLRELELKLEMKAASKICTNCSDQISKIAKFEIENIDLQNKCSSYLKEIQNLRESLEKSQITIDDLKQKTILKAEHDRLLNELKEQASRFNDYIKNQSPPKPDSRDQSVSTSPSTASDSRSTMENEMKIRQESAKILAAQIKCVEDNFKQQIAKFKTETDTLRSNLEEARYHLQLRTSEVHVLKQAILSERTKIVDILKQKDSDSTSIFDKQNSLLKRCQMELNSTQQQIEILRKENDDRRDQFDAELKSMEMLLQQCTDEKRTLERTIESIKMDHSKALEMLHTKYKSAKRTAANYKKYAEDKDKHVAQETERIKLAYDAAVKRIQEKANEAVRKKLFAS